MTLTINQETQMAEKINLNIIPPKYRGIFEKAYSGSSRTTALKAKCLECCCFQKRQVETCKSRSCPLWNYRPYGKNTRKKPAVKETKTETSAKV